MNELRRLCDLKIGQRAVIHELKHQDTHTILRLLELGFVPGESLFVEQQLPMLTGALTVVIQQNIFGIGYLEAADVMVQVLHG